MRLVILALAASACTPASWTAQKIKVPREGVPLDLFCTTRACTASHRGVVTARGGDRADFYELVIPPHGCDAKIVKIELEWDVPREGSKLGLSMWGPHGRVAALDDDHEDEDDYEDEENEDIAGATSRLVIHEPVTTGTYLIGVRAVGATGAGEYTLDVREETLPCATAWGQPAIAIADIYIPRPDGTPPTKAPLFGVTAAGLSRSSQTPSLVLDGTDGRVAKGARMWLVDSRGKRVRHGEIEIVETWSPDGSTRFASARFVTPGWFRRRMERGWSYWSAMLGGSSSARR